MKSKVNQQILCYVVILLFQLHLRTSVCTMYIQVITTNRLNSTVVQMPFELTLLQPLKDALCLFPKLVNYICNLSISTILIVI